MLRKEEGEVLLLLPSPGRARPRRRLIDELGLEHGSDELLDPVLVEIDRRPELVGLGGDAYPIAGVLDALAFREDFHAFLLSWTRGGAERARAAPETHIVPLLRARRPRG